MRRRQFLALLGSMAIGCPADVVAQKSDRVRQIGVLRPATAGDAVGLVAALQQDLEKRGWTIGRNVRIDYRWGIDNVERTKAAIAELLALAPDVILASTSQAVVALQQATRTVDFSACGTTSCYAADEGPIQGG